ncbi:uncharacterized protein LOC126844581 [Adelges cooleyi]|uniref:uncharacterized protein LOC126844581 n=1 Tax=Adelges cooleyi TaxID=133065 RepID=UPI0021804037|nr:uncharacterized protein LOC126844581 [Adelges cooleyi]XP_050438829.1 uncharacterized protein LOC126844581 [Adelges cooleyi]
MDSNNDKSKQPPTPQLISTTVDIYQLCRLCLNTLQADEGKSVFNNQVPSLPEKIYRVFGVRITDAKDLPNKLCLKCVQNTELCYGHRETYKRQERVLYDLLQKTADEKEKYSPKSEFMYSSADSNNSSLSGIGSDTQYVENANNIDNITSSPPYETNASLASHVEVIQECDEMAAEVTIAHDSEETVSEDDTICLENNAEYGTYNNDENIIVVKTEPGNDTDVEYKHEDRMGLLLFAARHIQEMTTEGDDWQAPGIAPKAATVVHGNLLSSDQNCTFYQTQGTVGQYSDGHQVQQQVMNINASPNIPIIPRKRISRESSVQRMCSNCGTTCSTIWRRLKEDPVCNACGLYYKLHGKIRPPAMRRDTIHTRQRRKISNKVIDISMNKKKYKKRETATIKIEPEEECEVEQAESSNSVAVEMIIEEPVYNETPYNLANK